jgi:adenosylmethionine-8-amino-7-oxononanoate aminotransferase
MTCSAVQFLVAPSDYISLDQMPVAAQGVRVRYADGHEALCGTSGVWNVSLGYGDRAIATAIHQAAEEASFLGQFRGTNRYAEEAAAALLELPAWKFSRVLFSTSGSAAVDAAIKIAYLTATLRQAPHQHIMVSFRGSYHGMTLAAMGVAGQDIGQRFLRVRQSDTRLIDYNDAVGVRSFIESFGDRIAGFIIEPVLGSGTLPISPDVISIILTERNRYGYVVIADEVATGFGRTGPMFASDRWPEAPDVLIVSKALTNGTMAASGILLSPQLTELQKEFNMPIFHAETQAGSSIASAAITATIKEYKRLEVLQRSEKVTEMLDLWLRHMAKVMPGAVSHGQGCFRSLHLRDDEGCELTSVEITKLVESSRRAGATIYPGPSAIQFIPALIYEPVLLQRYLEIVEDTLTVKLT